MVYLLDDIWNYIKEFIFHNIKTQGKHLKNDKNIKKYNEIIKKIPLLITESDSVRILYNSKKNTKKLRFIKFVYVIRHKNIRKLIIERQIYEPIESINYKWGGKREDKLHNKFREEYYSNIKNAANKKI